MRIHCKISFLYVSELFNDYFFQITFFFDNFFQKKHFKVRFVKIDPKSIKQHQKFFEVQQKER